MIVRYDDDTGKIRGTATGSIEASEFNEPVIQVSDDTNLENKRVDTDSQSIVWAISLSEARRQIIEEIKQRANEILSETDWYVTRMEETGESIPKDVLDHRSAVRSKSDKFESDVNALDTVEDVFAYQYSFPDPPQ